MNEEERAVLQGLIDYHNRMVGYYHAFVRQFEGGPPAPIALRDAVGMFNEVEALRLEASRAEIYLWNRSLRPPAIATSLGSTWRLLFSVALSGKVRLVPQTLQLKEPLPVIATDAFSAHAAGLDSWICCRQA